MTHEEITAEMQALFDKLAQTYGKLQAEKFIAAELNTFEHKDV